MSIKELSVQQSVCSIEMQITEQSSNHQPRKYFSDTWHFLFHLTTSMDHANLISGQDSDTAPRLESFTQNERCGRGCGVVFPIGLERLYKVKDQECENICDEVHD